MPDQLPSSILNPTLSDDSLFALNIDTKRRFEAMNETFQKPMSMPDYSIPQSSLTDNSITKGTIGEALFNPDPKIARDAQNAIQSKMDELPTKSNIGVPEFFHWDKSMDKYLNKTYGYNPYISMADNEDFYYENQYLTKSVVGKLLANTTKGLTRFTTGVGLKLVQTLGQTAGLLWNGIQEIIEAAGGPQNNAMADVADNSLARWAMHAEEYLKNTDLLAVYKPSDWEDKGFFEKLRSGAFWSDEIADGAAFMGEMVLSTYLLGGLGKIGGLSKFGATSINTASKLGKAGKALDWVIKALTGANDISGIGRWAFLTASESAMEASEGYKNHKERLQIERSLGKNNYTDDQIVKLAGDVASSQFKDNMLILGLSSAFENRFIFEPLFGKAGRQISGKSWRSRIGISSSTESLDDLAKAEIKKYNYKTILGKFSDWKNPNSRLRFYGSRFGEATLAEGYWEENAQLATERLSVNEGYNTGDFLERKYELARKTLSQAASTLPKWTGIPGSEVTDKEADTAIGLGGVIGILGTGIIAKAVGGDRNILVEDKDKPGEFKKQKNGWFEGERRKIDRTAQESINVYEKARREFLSFNDIYERTANELDKDGNVIKKGEVIKDEFGNPIIDIEKAKGVLDGVYNMSDKFDVIGKVEDPLNKKFLQDRAIGSFVLAAKGVGLFEKSLEAFNNLDKIDAKQLEELGFDPNTIVDHKWMQESLKETGEEYDRVYKNTQVPKKGQTERDEAIRKHTLFVSRITVNSANRIAKEYEKAYREVLADTVDIDNLEEYNMDVNQYNLILLQKQKLEQFKKTRDLKDDFFAEHIKAQEEKIDNELAKLTNDLNVADSLNMDQFGEAKLGISPLGIRYSKERYAHLKSTERIKLDNIDASFTPIPNQPLPPHITKIGYTEDELIEERERLAAIHDEIDSVPTAKEIRTTISELDLQLLQDHKDILKQGELLNTLAQYEYLAEQLSHPENGIANAIAYQKHIDTIRERDIEEDEKEKKEVETKIKNYSIVPVTEDDVTTFDVLDKDNKIIGNFETEDEAKAKIEELTKDIPEKKPPKEPEQQLTYEELRELVLEILKSKMEQFGMAEKEDEEVLKLVPILITDEASRNDLSDEELAALTAYVEAYNERLAKQILNPEEIESFGYKIRLEPDGKWKIYNSEGESLGLTFDTKELAIRETQLADIERRRQEELNAQNSRIEEEKNKLEQKAKKKKTIIEWFTRDGKPSPPSPNGIYIEEIDNWHREQGHISRTREVENLTEGEVNKELKAIESGNQWKISQINAKYDAELAALEETSGVSGSALKDVVPVFHHTKVDVKDFDFGNFQRGKNQVSQFGDGLAVSTDTTPFLQKRYGNPIKGEVKDSDFVVIDTNKTEKEIYEELKSKGYKFNKPDGGSYIGNDPAKEYDGTEKANEQPAIISLFNDFQKSNPEVKGVKIVNHIIANEKVSPFYVIYDNKSFYGEGSLKAPTQYTEAAGVSGSALKDVEAKKADIERRREEELKNAGLAADLRSIISSRLIKEGVSQEDRNRLIGTQSSPIITSVTSEDISNLLISYQNNKNKQLEEFNKQGEGFNPSTGNFVNNDTSFWDNKISIINTINAKYDAERDAVLGKKEKPPEEPKGDSMPLMITKQMEIDLKKLGWSQEQIDKMVPKDAWDIIKSNKKPPNEPPPPPSGIPGISSKELYDEVKHAYDLWEQALLNETDFKEEADKENLVSANNEISRRIDDSKNTGKITIVTSNPRELDSGNSLITVGDDIKLLRHNFLNKLQSGQIDKNKIKLSLQISKDDNIYARITDNNGQVIYFDKDANRVKQGMHLDFFLDGLNLFSGENLPKRRSEVVKFDNISPLSSNPVILNEVFLKDGKPRTDILDILKERIKKENVLATINFITQGLLVREGSTNDYNNIPKNLPTRTIEELQKNGELVEPIGSIKINDDQVNGIFQKKQRINFSLWRNINDHEQGSEIVEFRPVPLGEVQTSDGKNLMESLQIDVNGTKMSIFEAGVQGILPSSPRVIYTLKNLLRPDKFIVLNLGNTVIIINAVKFTKFLKSGNITLEELKKLTTLDDIKNSELNIFKSDYDKNSSEDMLYGILIDNKYMDFINKNVRTSVLSVKKEPNSMGVARINKRLVVTLDKNITDMLKEENQVDITGKTTVIPVDDIAAPLDIEKLFEESKDISPDEISKGITKNNC